MPASNAITGYDTAFAIDDGAGTFNELAELIDIKPPNQQSDDVEVTNYKSPNRTKEYIPGLIEPGEMTFDINWIPSDATDQIIQALKTSGAVRAMKITWPNGVTWSWDGYIKGFEPTAPLNDRMTGTVTVKVSGATTIA